MTDLPPPSGAPGRPPYGPTPPGGQYPPPGAQYPPPGDPRPPWPTPYGGPGPQSPPPWGPPVHQPGVVPLRPLTLGDMFGGALKTIRHNPKATVGMAMLVTFGFMLIPIAGTLVLGAADVLPAMDPLAGDPEAAAASDAGLFATSVISGVFSGAASIVVTGLIVRTVEQAVVGQPLTAGEAWRRSRGRLLPLVGLLLVVGVGLTLVVGLPIALGVLVAVLVDTTLGVVMAVLGGVLGVVAAAFLYTRYVLLAPPVLVLEERGVFASMARAGRLSRGDFWRLLGIYLLASLAAALVSQVVAIPFAVLGFIGLFALPESWAFTSMLLSSHVSSVLTGGLVGPFTGGVLALQYMDQRFRKEGLDIELLNQTAMR